MDPRDMFRGDYVVLNYEISRIESWQAPDLGANTGDEVYVALQRHGRFWAMESVSTTRPEEGVVFIRGRVRDQSEDAVSVEYGIESYFVPEGKGRELESAAGRGLVAEIAVDRHGRAAIRGVRIEPQSGDAPVEP